MTSLDGLLRLLDTRSFPSLWFWITLALAWSVVNRGVLGVPGDVITRARADAEGHGMTLLDWMSLTLPRRRMGQGEAAFALGTSAFGLTCLGLLGFAYGLEMAQALSLLLVPLALLGLTRVLLARRMAALLDEARAGAVPPEEAARTAAAALMRHRWIGTGLSILSVAGAAAWGTLWNIIHPNGL